MIEEELAKVKDRLAELQNAKKASRQMYDAACMRLGVPNDLEAEEARDSAALMLIGVRDFPKQMGANAGASNFTAEAKFGVDWLNKIPGLHCPRPEGAFYVYPSCAGLIC